MIARYAHSEVQRKRNRTKTTETDTIIVSSSHRRCSTREYSVLLLFYVSVFLPNSIDDFARRFEIFVAQWLDLFTATGTKRKRDTEKNVFQTEHIRLARDWAIRWCGDTAANETHESRETEKKPRDFQALVGRSATFNEFTSRRLRRLMLKCIRYSVVVWPMRRQFIPLPLMFEIYLNDFELRRRFSAVSDRNVEHAFHL